MHQQEKWRTIIGSVLVDTQFELVGVECLGGGKHTTVRVYIDKPGGITIDDIVQLTRQINVVLDVEAPIKGPYTLEVSSPGLDRPLFNPNHFKQQIGQKISVRTRFLLENRQNFKGILLQTNDEGIQLDVEGQLFSLAYEDIEKARVIPNIKIAGGK
jgi:ribosome maturation factor RimP